MTIESSYWTIDADGSWTTPDSWYTYSGSDFKNVIPGSDDAVSLTPYDPTTKTYKGTTPFVLSYNATDVVASIQGPAFATLDITGGALTITGSLSLDGALIFSGTTLSAQHGGSISGPFTQTTGTITGDGILLLAGGASFSNSTAAMTGSGTTILEGMSSIGRVLSLDGGRVLENRGTLTWAAGDIDLGDNPYGVTVGGGTIKNDAGAVFDDQANNEIVSSKGVTAFINAGTYEKTRTAAGTGGGTTYVLTPFINTGSVVVQSGALDLYGGGSSAASALSVASGAVLGLDGSFALGAGTIAGSGQVNLNGGLLSLGTGDVTIAPTFWQDGGTISGSGTLTLSQGVIFETVSALMTGSGTTVLQGNSAIAPNDGFSVALDGGRRLENRGTLAWFYGSFALGYNPFGTSLGGATIENDVGATFDLAVDGSLSSYGTTAIINAGTMEKTAGTGFTSINSPVTNSGLLSVQSGTLVLNGPLWNTGSVSVGSDATLELDAGNPSNAVRGGASSNGRSLLNGIGGLVSLVDDAAITSTGGTFDNAGGVLAKTAGTGTSTIDMAIVDASGARGRIEIASGTLEFDGVDDFRAQTISGAGSLALGAGSHSVIEPGTTIATSGFSVSGAGTSLRLGENLSYAGSFRQAHGVMNIAANTLTLTGSVDLSGQLGSYVSVTGSGVVATSGSATLSGVNFLASAHFQNSGTVTQTGNVGVGDPTNGAATISNRVDATWSITNDSLIAGDSALATFVNDGTLIKSGGTGTSVVRPALGSSTHGAGTVEVASGTLEFTQAISGHESLKTASGTTLILDAGASAGTAFSFEGTAGTLQLGNAQAFHGTIANFSGSQAIDLGSIGYAGQTPRYATTSSGAGVLTVTDGTHMATLAMSGQYVERSFHLASDGHGGTLIRYGG